MNTSEILIKILWSDYVGLVKDGMPVYFTFTRDSIEDLFSANEIQFDDAQTLINKCACEYLTVSGEHVYLKPNALVPNESEYSAAILIACQQILVVEEMVRNEEHSHNAYFPHLRRNISDSLGTLSQNPFLYQEFENIWRCLSKEVYAINQDDKCVTFNFDNVKGMNKARRFPLSQALLTKEDAVRLIDEIGQSSIKSENEDWIFRRVVTNRSILSHRGKKLTKLPWMRHALVNQLRRLSSSVGGLKSIREAIEKNENDVSKMDVSVYLDSIDWLNNEYVINIFNESGDMVRDVEVVNSYFRLKIETKNYVLLVPNQEGDEWIYSDSEYFPKLGDDLIILYGRNDEGSAFSVISAYFNLDHSECIKDEIIRAKKYNCIKFKVGAALDKKFSIKSGQITVLKQSAGQHCTTFFGGITVNKNEDIYSAYHLPTSIEIIGVEYKLSGRIKINGRYRLFEDFRDEIREIDFEDTYCIEIEGVGSAKLKVAPRYAQPTSEIFYQSYKHSFMPISTYSKENFTSESYSIVQDETPQIYLDLCDAKKRSDIKSIFNRLGELQR